MELFGLVRERSVGEERDVLECLWEIFDVIEFFVPLRKGDLIYGFIGLDFPQFLRNFPLLNIHNLFVLGLNKKLLPLLLLEIPLPLRHLMLNLLKFPQLLLLNIQALLAAILDHPLDISFLLVELVAVIVLLVVDLVILVEL